MRRTITGLIGALLIAASLTISGSAVSAASGPANHDAASGPVVQGADDCWTTFAPANPYPGPMNHYYMNCNPQTIWVMPVFYVGGATYTYSAMCSKAPQNRKIEWFYPSTDRANYSTEVCDPYHPLSGRTLIPPPASWK
jgi:hypothetical protein